MFNILKDAWKIDIFDMNYAFSSEKLGLLHIKEAHNLPKKGMLYRFFLFCAKHIATLFKLEAKAFSPTLKGKPLFFVNTKNQFDSVHHIAALQNDTTIMGLNEFCRVKFPLFYAYIFTPLFIFKNSVTLLRGSAYQKKSVAYAIDYYLLTQGYYYVARKYLRFIKPPVVVLANDHQMQLRVVASAAKAENIPTCFIMHAPSNENFPPLMFDYAFLEGMDAAKKYDACGKSDTKVFLTGSSKLDADTPVMNTNTTVRTVGICTNELDNYDDVKSVVHVLANKVEGITFVMRPHPGDHRFNRWESLAKECSMQFSNSREVSAAEFLDAVDAVIAAETGIHIEAVSKNIVPIHYTFTKNEVYDHYRFIENGLIDLVHDKPEALVLAIESLQRKKPDVRHRAAYYYGNIGTPYENRASSLISELLTEIRSKGSINLDRWERVEDFKNLAVYQLR